MLMTADHHSDLPAPGQRPRRRPGDRLRNLMRELVSWPTLLVIAFCLLVGIPVTVALTPNQQLVVLGQHISVGARPPSLSLSGPAQLVRVGNTELDIAPLQVHGPLRPQLTLGPVQRNEAAAEVLRPDTTRQARADAASTLGNGFLRWYVLGGLGLVAFTLSACAVAGCARMLTILRRQGRTGREHVTIAEIGHRCAGTIGRMIVLAVTASVLTWGVSGALAYSGAARGLADVRSLSELVGAYHLSPSPVGPKVFGYSGAVIGDSRAARVGGPPPDRPTPEDVACERSADSLAGELSRLLPAQVLNLACSGASIAQGLRGPQQRGDTTLPAQVGRLKQVQDLRFVVVAIGPNDLGWSDFLTYCYGVADCADNLTQGEFDYRLAAFDREYGNLLQDLDELPGRPQVVIVSSYDVFDPGADCPDSRGPAQAAGLTPDKIELLTERNAQLNAILAGGAEKYGFDVARPGLTRLCRPGTEGLGPDLQGLSDSHPFHPTGIGSIRMAAGAARLISPENGG
ncbi:GDSL-type esterase/lipase family protein [Pseudonocardia sp. H11422]|uniref:GDSL-type esterase/lipase family protein n=1 Tax=Pseudonocardia sp. H11422 TaxID=2835866 RepID=UPI00202839CF|nr:GDSL-type esterase/lipase family protein [Pseudonocardia sp. H11422]